MEWYTILSLVIGSFFLLVLFGIPIVFAFFGVNIVFLYYFMGFSGFDLFINGIYGSLSNFVLLPITLFILMGEILFRTGIANRMINTLDTWLTQVPGRLALLTVGSGTLLATLSGSSIGAVALLTRTLAPVMEKRNYSTNMIIGPILGSGGLSVMIPPSALGVILAVIASVSVGKLLIAIIIPGLLIALGLVIYVVALATFDKNAAPKYEEEKVPYRKRIKLTVKYVLPLSIIVFLVIGSVFLGIATPTEAAALGTMGALGLTIFYKSFTFKIVSESLYSTLRISVMVLVVLAASQAFTQLLAYTGATQALVAWAVDLPLEPLSLIILMHLVTLILGGPIGGIPLIMMTIPVFMPIVGALGYDPVWFCVVMLINIELAQITPPFGILLFVVKGIAKKLTIINIIRAAFPIMMINVIVAVMVIFMPELALWLPNKMQ